MPMYRPLNPTTEAGDLVNGVQLVRQWVAGFTPGPASTPGPDGLTVVTPDTPVFQNVAIPDRLCEWLVGLRLLRGVPLSYLVPDARLLPPESIRFFFVDPNWTERVVDGVFAAASAGTIASSFHIGIMQMVRPRLDEALCDLAELQNPTTSWEPGPGPTTGMLIRSELVRRWPDLIVTAHAGSSPNSEVVPVLRAEPISREVFIAVFAGQPGLVQVREPHVGVRFGVEPTVPGAAQGPYKVNRRKVTGESIAGANVNIDLRPDPDRVIDIEKLALALPTNQNPVPGEARFVALHLEQRPYVQRFTLAVDESTGSQPIPKDIQGNYVATLELSKKRQMRMQNLVTRRQQQADLQGGDD